MPSGEPSMDGLEHLWVSHYGRNRRGIPKQLYADDGGATGAEPNDTPKG